MTQPPKITVPRSVAMPPVEKIVLANGLPVYVITADNQDVTRVSFVWGAGSAMQSKPFAASAALNLMSEGSERFTAHEIAEKLDFVGSYFDVSLDRDYAVMTFCALAKFFAPTLEIMSQIVLHPIFPDEEVAIYTRKRMERLALERSKPGTKAREAFAEALFGAEHPYGVSSPEGDYLKLGREDIRDFWERFYGAENCFVVCSLGTSDKQRAELLEVLERLPKRKLRITNYELRATQKSERFRRLKVADAVQSTIRTGRLLFTREHPDFVGMQVIATILGGYFGSRLMQNLREERGYTYGVTAAMVNLRAAGYLAIATEVGVEATDDAIRQIFSEMERLKGDLVSEDELENVRRSMLGEVMRVMDGPFGVVDAVIEGVQIGASGDYVADFIRGVEAITPVRIRELARKYLDMEEFTTVVVG